MDRVCVWCARDGVGTIARHGFVQTLLAVGLIPSLEGITYPIGVCPECLPLASEAHGAVIRAKELRRPSLPRLANSKELADIKAKARKILGGLLEWEDNAGGFTADVWREAQEFFEYLDSDPE